MIWELRRLQRFLDEERDQQRFCHAIDLQSDDRPPTRPRGERRPPAKQPDSKVERLLDKLGLNRRKSAKRPRPRGEPPARQPARQDAKVLRSSGKRACAAGATLIMARSCHGCLRRIALQAGHQQSADIRGRTALAAGHDYLRSQLPHGSACTKAMHCWSGGRRPPDWTGQKRHSQKAHANLRGELKIGLRVLIIGAGIVGGWACLVPLSGAVIVPGTLVVESDVKKIQHPAGGVVASIPVRDGLHVRAGDVLLRLDETQIARTPRFDAAARSDTRAASRV